MIVYIEAAGCPNVCRHCVADGRRPYGAHFSLDELRTLREEWGPLTIYHEPTAHPQFPEIFDPQLMLPHGGHAPINGFGLAQRSDYAAVLARMYDLGLRTLHFTIHGLRDHHDWFVCRKGAFCAPRLLLGNLSDGKAAIVQRLQEIAAPAYRGLTPNEIVLAPEEREELHPACFSVRYKGISKVFFSSEPHSVHTRPDERHLSMPSKERNR